MRKILLSLLLFSLCGSMIFAQEPLEINDVERVPLGILHTNGETYMTVPSTRQMSDYIKLQLISHSQLQQGRYP